MSEAIELLVENDAFVAVHQPDQRLVSVFFLASPTKQQVADLSIILAGVNSRSDAVLIYIDPGVSTPSREVRDDLSKSIGTLIATVPGIVCVVPGTGIGASVKRTMSSVILTLAGLRAPAIVVGNAASAGEWLAERLDKKSFDAQTMTAAVEQAVAVGLSV